MLDIRNAVSGLCILFSNGLDFHDVQSKKNLTASQPHCGSASSCDLAKCTNFQTMSFEVGKEMRIVSDTHPNSNPILSMNRDKLKAMP